MKAAARNVVVAFFIFALGSITGPALGVPTVITLGPGEEITIRAAEAPEVSPSTTLTPSATPSQSPLSTPSSTPTPSATSSPASTSTPTPSATFAPTPSPTPTPSPSPAPTPTASTSPPTPSPTPTPTTTPPPTPTTEYVGFGSVTDGGTGYPVVAVTNRNDTGPGSLRAALSGGGRIVRVDVTGTIDLKTILYVRSSDVTLLGNGITLSGWPIWLQGAHDVIIRDLRHRGGAGVSQSSDNITLGQGTSRVILDHLSLSGQGDEAIGIWDRVTDVTISNTLIGPGFAAHNYGILIGEKSHRVSVFRNVLTGIEYRSPAAGWDDRNGTSAPSIVADVVNNVIWDAGYAGTTTYWGGKANVRGNYYQGTSKPLEIGSKGQAFSLGNYSSNGGSLSGNVSAPFAVPGYAILVGADARQNAIALLDTVGCRVTGLDALDVILLEDIRP